MIGTDINKEMAILKNVFDFEIMDFQKITLNAINGAFISIDEKTYITTKYINPFFDKYYHT